MSLPTLTKTWQFNVNNAQTAQGTALADNRKVLRAIKDAMLGFGTLPWTCFYSCDSTTAGTAGDAVDRWTTDAKLVWNSAGSAHSWFVFKQTGMGSASNGQVLIDLNTSTASGVTMTMKYSPNAGFTGGTTTAAPTATDSTNLINGAAWTSIAADAALRWSVMQSSDGQCTRVFIFSAGTLETYWMFERFANATGGTPGATNGGWGCVTTALTGATIQNGVNSATVISYESVSNLSIASEVSGVFDIFPIGIAITATVGARGKLGTLQDVWLTSSGIATGDTFPATGSPAAQFIVINQVVLPWNNGAFNLT